ncbi:6-hydroxy-D-nicotine oxidase [Ilyonectria robusta]
MKPAHLYLLGHLFVSMNAADTKLQKDCLPLPRDGTNCQQACEILASEFPGRLHYDGSDNNFTIWDQKQLETVYVCRAEPASADEVSRVLQVLVNNWCRFAVKCGGHSRFPDDAVSVGGVTIDLGLINSTVVSDDRTTARIGGGSLTRQVFAALDPYGLAYVGGRVGQVGMGGFTLGGGTSVLAARYGWALDHVLEYERPVYAGSRTFTDDQTDRFLKEAEKIFSIQDYEDTNIGLEYRYAYSVQNGWTMSSTQRYAEPVMNPPVFNALNSIPALGNLTGGINSLASSTSFSGPLGITSWTTSALDNAAYALADDFIADFREAAESVNAFHPFVYINYANKGQDVFAGYGKENQQRLVEIQQAIDPRGVFTSSGLWTGFFKVR